MVISGTNDSAPLNIVLNLCISDNFKDFGFHCSLHDQKIVRSSAFTFVGIATLIGDAKDKACNPQLLKFLFISQI